jgi:Na+/proline symporter
MKLSIQKEFPEALKQHHWLMAWAWLWLGVAVACMGWSLFLGYQGWPYAKFSDVLAAAKYFAPIWLLAAVFAKLAAHYANKAKVLTTAAFRAYSVERESKKK